MKITAHPMEREPWPIVPAPPDRWWMERQDGFSRKCLPLTMANRIGWTVLSPVTFSCRWNGRDDPHHGSMEFDFKRPGFEGAFKSHFGQGIVTVQVPYLFTTDEPGTGLYVGGPPNHWIDNFFPLSGWVETWWLPFTFTMNWRIVQPYREVVVEKGEPVCWFIPLAAAPLTDVVCAIEPEMPPDLLLRWREWDKARRDFNASPTRSPGQWQAQYHKGCPFSGEPPRDPHHLTSIDMPHFEDQVTKMTRDLQSSPFIEPPNRSRSFRTEEPPPPQLAPSDDSGPAPGSGEPRPDQSAPD